jgi:Zn-dependent M32 family carboxypeptidase
LPPAISHALAWLGENVHRHGQRYTVAAIIERATGSIPELSALIESLSRRYRRAR